MLIIINVQNKNHKERLTQVFPRISLTLPRNFSKHTTIIQHYTFTTLSHFSHSHVTSTGDKMNPDRHKAKKMENDDKMPTLDLRQAEQLRPFMSTRQRVGRQRNRGSVLGKDKTYISSPKGQTGSGIYSACQQVPETLSWSYSCRRLKLNTHLHLVSRLWMNVTLPMSLHTLSWGAQSQTRPLKCLCYRWLTALRRVWTVGRSVTSTTITDVPHCLSDRNDLSTIMTYHSQKSLQCLQSQCKPITRGNVTTLRILPTACICFVWWP